MKICVAQTKPVKGDIEANIKNHKKLIDLAVANNAGMIIFPELSVTGYEPELAKALAADKNDKRFRDFQNISDDQNISIGVGMPLKSDEGILISMLIFQPDQPLEIYSKQYLHEDEYPYFVSGRNQKLSVENNHKISFAICYELSVPEHAEKAFENKAGFYIASVAKSASGIEKACERLSAIAKKYSMYVLMSNCAGHCDNFDCGGKSSVWNNKGSLLAQLDDENEALLIFDSITEEIIKK